MIPEPIRPSISTVVNHFRNGIRRVYNRFANRNEEEEECLTAEEDSSEYEAAKPEIFPEYNDRTSIELLSNGRWVKVFSTAGNLNFNLTDIIMDKITRILEPGKGNSIAFLSNLSWRR